MSLKNSLSKIGMILKAYLTEDPVGEEFYEKRLEICRNCEWNSDNVKEPLSFKQKATQDTLCPGKPICTACGCCIHKKAKVTTVDCGLSEIGQEPKWTALVKDNQLDTNIRILNLSPEVGDVGVYGHNFVYNVGNVTEDVVRFTLSLNKKKGKFDVKSVGASCGCTATQSELKDDQTLVLHVDLSTDGFLENQQYTKRVTVSHYVNRKTVKNINIDIRLTKVKPDGGK